MEGGSGEETMLAMDTFPYVALSKVTTQHNTTLLTCSLSLNILPQISADHNTNYNLKEYHDKPKLDFMDMDIDMDFMVKSSSSLLFLIAIGMGHRPFKALPLNYIIYFLSVFF